MSRPTVMVSSTAFDLPEHREQVRDACLRSGFAPDEMMENLNAIDADAIEASLTMVDKADVYVGIFAFRYGYVPNGGDISITEMEYQRAVKQKKPRLLFFMDDDHPITARMVETGTGAEKLKALKERAGRDRVARFFKSPDALRGDVISALHELRPKLDKSQNAPNESAQRLHRRTPIPVPPTPYIAHPYTLSHTRDLIGREEELNALTYWGAEPGSPSHDAPIFCFVAIGGMGKSALTWKWFKDIAPEEIPDLAGRLWWSFYESDAHFENFLNRALCYVGALDEDDVRNMPWQDRETLLLQHLNEKPYLLVLDGLERVLLAYNRLDASSLADDEYDQQTANYVADAASLPASATQTVTSRHRLRQTTDPRAGYFLKKLVALQKSRILISTRLYPLALQLPNRRPCPGITLKHLKGLSDDNAISLWRALGVYGARQELVPFFKRFGSHPLLIQALAGEIARNRKSPSDFTAWRAANPSFDPTSLPVAQVKSHVLEYALTGLSRDINEVLTTLVAFRMPASYDSLEALLVGSCKTYRNASDLDKALTELEDRGLIGWDREANRYDAHPIIRGVVWQLAGKADQEAVYGALEAHFEPMQVPEWHKVNSLHDLTPAIERYYTLVGLGRYDDAFTLFIDRLLEAMMYRLAAYRDQIALLELLFPKGVERPSSLTRTDYQIDALTWLAGGYNFSGRPTLAGSLLRRSYHLSERANQKQHLQVCASNLGWISRETGHIRQSVEFSLEALRLCRDLNDKYWEAVVLSQLGRTASVIGDKYLSRVALERSKKIYLLLKNSNKMHLGVDLKDRNIDGNTLIYLGELALWEGSLSTAERFADQSVKLAENIKYSRVYAQALLLKTNVLLSKGNIRLAETLLPAAVSRARSLYAFELSIYAQITSARLSLKCNRMRDAKSGLEEMWDDARHGTYPLYQADAYNVLADICRAEGDKDDAIDAAAKAYRAAWCDGPPWAYHWGLQKAKTHLQALGVSEPDMSPFDESKFEPMPEVEINPKEEYWVDPNEPLEALLDLN